MIDNNNEFDSGNAPKLPGLAEDITDLKGPCQHVRIVLVTFEQKCIKWYRSSYTECINAQWFANILVRLILNEPICLLIFWSSSIKLMAARMRVPTTCTCSTGSQKNCCVRLRVNMSAMIQTHL